MAVATTGTGATLVRLGVRAYIDADAFAWTHTAELHTDDAGVADGLREQRERWLADCRGRFAVECARASHERLTAAAEDGCASAPGTGDAAEELVLDGAYLVRADRRDAFEAAVAELASAFSRDGVRFELTGP
jgi:hypothetical protein